MLNLIKYSSLKLKDVEEPIVPQGPSFNQCGLIKHNLGGNCLQFRSPKHRPRNTYSKSIYEKRYKNMEFYTKLSNNLEMSDESWRYRTIFMRTWSYNGSWFTGKVYQQSLHINILEPNQINKKISFFHPRAFETTILQLLTSSYSHYDGCNARIAPVNWKPLTQHPMPAVTFTVSIPMRRLDDTKQIVIIPLFQINILLSLALVMGENSGMKAIFQMTNWSVLNLLLNYRMTLLTAFN